MKLFSIFVFLILANLCFSRKNRLKKISIKTGKQNHLSNPKILKGANQKKKDILNMMKKVNSVEEFLKTFKIPFKKVKKVKKTKPTNNKFGGKFGFKGLTGSGGTSLSGFKPKDKIEYNFVLGSSSSSLKPAGKNFRKKSPSNKSPSYSASLADSPIACKPRTTVYSLPYSESHANFPACFELNQCGGCCSNLPGHVCSPTELHVEKKGFIRIHYSDGSYSSETVTLKHHKKCACQCKTQPSDCLSTQYYDMNYCGCFCKKDQGASCSVHQEWSPTKCQCVCKNKISCGYRKMWNEKTCGCQCSPTTCSQGQTQDPTTCLCLKTSSKI